MLIFHTDLSSWHPGEFFPPPFLTPPPPPPPPKWMMKYYSIQIQTTYNTAFITKLPLRFITKSVYFGTEDFTGPLKAAKQNHETLNIIFHNNFQSSLNLALHS